MLDVFCTAYLDDVLIFSETREEHIRHLREVHARLRRAGLYIDIDKSEFFQTEVKYLGMIISTAGLRMDPDKVETVLHWPIPRNVKDVRAFLGFANFYRRFIKDFSKIALPMTKLTKTVEGTPKFLWTPECQKAFDYLKKAFTSNPILRHFDPDAECWVEVDASDLVVAGVLSQPDEAGVLHPVAFFSKKMSPQECNYEIYDKELLAIVQAFEEWRPELVGSTTPVKVLSDHRTLEYFMTTKELNRRQARWSEFLSEFNFKINYRPGKQGTKPDSLTRRSADTTMEEDDARRDYQRQVILKTHNLEQGMLPPVERGVGLIQPSQLKQACLTIAATEMTTTEQPSLQEQIMAAYQNDEDTQMVITALQEEQRQLPAKLSHLRIALADCAWKDGKLYYQERVWVPKDPDLRYMILSTYHELPASGHRGKENTYKLVLRDY